MIDIEKIKQDLLPKNTKGKSLFEVLEKLAIDWKKLTKKEQEEISNLILMK